MAARSDAEVEEELEEDWYTASDAEVEEELEGKWYTALYEEDCRQLLELLDERESLWSKGWESEKREVTGRPGNYWFPEKTIKNWEGRTALHCAAQRGCVTLIDRVVGLCKGENAVSANSRSGSELNRHANGRAETSQDSDVQALTPEDAQARQQTPETIPDTRDDRENAVSANSRSGSGLNRPANGRTESSQSSHVQALTPEDAQARQQTPETIPDTRDDREDAVSANSRSGSGLNRPANGRTESSQGSHVQALTPEDAQARQQTPETIPDTRDDREDAVSANSRSGSGLNRPANGRTESSQGSHVQASTSEGAQPREQTPGSPLTSWLYESERIITMVQREGADVSHDYVDNAAVCPGYFSSLVRSDIDGEGRALAPVSLQNTELGNEESAQWSMSLEKFLLKKDGEYKLDAFAMALVNGNPDVIVALVKGSDKCPTLRAQYRIESCEGNPPTERAADHRLLLTVLTKAVIRGVQQSQEPLLEEAIFRRYVEHRDYNFLPRKEYLFHFLLTRCRAKEMLFGTGPGASRASLTDIDRVYESLQTMLVKTLTQAGITDEFRCFLWELQDGQGRPPLHVSVDEDSFTRTSQLLAMIMNSNEALVQRIVNKPDGAGRTVWQRGAALGKTLDFKEFPLMNSMTTPQLSNWWKEIRMDGALHKIDADAVSSLNGLFPDHRTGIGASQEQGLGKIVLKGVGKQQIMPLHSAILLKQSSWIWNLADRLERSSSLAEMAHNDNWLGQTTSLPSSNMIKRERRRKRQPGLLKRLSTLRTRRAAVVDTDNSTEPRVALDCVGLAAMVGDLDVLSAVLEIQLILRDHLIAREVAHEGGMKAWKRRQRNDALHRDLMNLTRLSMNRLCPRIVKRMMKRIEVLPALHIAAASGRYDLVTMLTNNPFFDPSLVDSSGNTALHHAAKGLQLHFGHRLIDFVNCKQILETKNDRSKDSDGRYARQYPHDDSFLGERMGCINRRLQFRCDILKINEDGEAPSPSINMGHNFLSWWYEKQDKGFGTRHKSLSSAAGAISVTGALVATASFIGPLQPPGDIPSELRKGSLWMKVFIVCDAMSFYLAIGAIVYSLVPTLPIPQQSMMEELESMRVVLAQAVRCIYLSIIFVLIAFGAAFLEVTESHRISIGTIAVCGFLSLGAIILLETRTLAFAVAAPIKTSRKVYEVGTELRRLHL